MTRTFAVGIGLLVFAFGGAGIAPVAWADVAEGPVYVNPPQPEVNPWADKGIASHYTFAAYYTRKDADAQWHKDSRTDEYADVMVKFGNGPEELVFWRGSSYLPYWNTGKTRIDLPQVVERSGDGDARQPDRVNRYARVRIIESTAKRIVIHWRYMPKMDLNVGPANLPDQTRMVDEYFVITPDRSVLRAVLEGQSRYEDWRKSAPGRLFRYKLTDKGIDEQKVQSADKPLMMKIMGFDKEVIEHKLIPAPVIASKGLPAPVARFTFDEGKGLNTREAISRKNLEIEGHAAHWRSGVSGTALMYDGWTSQVRMKADLSDKISDTVTLDAWIAIAAYPWNTCTIVQQVKEEDDREVKGVMLPRQTRGVMLSMEANGNPSLWATMNGEPVHLKAEDAVIPRFRWTRLTGVIDTSGNKSKMTLYIDGKKVAEALRDKAELELADGEPIRIGQGIERMPYLPVGRGQYPSRYSFEGLIDEVGIYNTALTADQIARSSGTYAMTEARRTQPDMIRRVLPAGEKTWNDFAARYVHLPFHESWNKMFRVCDHPDIVVSFDRNATRYVLWHGVGYIPMLVSENGRWYSNEFNENWWKGCCEPMSDKKMVFGRVHILEQCPARVVLKWRYPLSTVGYEISYPDPNTGWGNWSNWYMTIYPDGTITKRMRVYQAKKRRHEWHESMAIMGPEQRPEMVVETRPALTVATTDGEVRNYDWINEPPAKVDYSDVILHIVNMKAQYDPYTIIRDLRGGNVYKHRGGTGYSAFPAWNHWPVAQIPSDGRHATFPDRTAHSSLTHVFWESSVEWGEQGLFEEKILMEGSSNKSAEQLLPLARSWTNPAAAEAGPGVKVEYDPAQRAYVLTRDSGSVNTLKVKLAGSQESPVVNPAFVVDNWGSDKPAKITTNPAFTLVDTRQGVVRRANGVNALIVWMQLHSTQTVEVTIQ